MDMPDELRALLLRAAHACAVTNERLAAFCITELEFASRMLAVAAKSVDDGIRLRTIQTARVAYFKAMATVAGVKATTAERSAIDAKCEQFQRQLHALIEEGRSPAPAVLARSN